MKKRSVIRTKKTLLVFIFSYIAIMCIPTITIFALNRQARHIIEQEEDRAITAILSQIRASVDTRLDDVYAQIMQIGASNKVDACMFMKEDLQSSDYYNIYQLRRELANYQAINAFVKDYAVYFGRSDIMVSSRSSYIGSLPVAYSTLYESPQLSYTDWYALLREKNVRKFVPIYQDEEKTELKAILCLQSISYQGLSNVTIMLCIDPTLLDVLIRDIGLKEDYGVTVSDYDGEAFYSTHMKQGQQIAAQLNPAGEEETVRINLEGTYYNITTVHSDKNDWTYIMSLPMEEHLRKSTYLQQIVLYALAACTCVSLVAACLFSWRNYSPIAQIMHIVSDKAEIPFGENADEFHYIKTAMVGMLDQNSRIASLLSAQRATMIGHLTARLLLGNLKNAGKTLLQWNDMRFDSDLFVVLLFVNEAVPNRDEGSDEDEDDDQTLYRQLKQTVPGVVQTIGQAYFSEMSEGIACLINLTCDAELAGAKLQDAAHTIQRLFEDRFARTLTIALSGVHQTITGIPAAYQETQEALDYKTQIDLGEILSFDSGVQEDRKWGGYCLTKEAEHILDNFISAGDTQQAVDFVRGLFSEPVHFMTLPIADARMLTIDIALLAVRCGRETDEARDLPNPSLIFHMQSKDELRNTAVQYVERVSAFIERQLHSGQDKILNEILRFIAREIGNPDLSVATIAEAFDMGPTSMSKYFKRLTGDGLLDYINRYRIQCAKKDLRETELSIKTIGERVGILSSNTFIRIFRKYEGITPGVYRTHRNGA